MEPVNPFASSAARSFYRKRRPPKRTPLPSGQRVVSDYTTPFRVLSRLDRARAKSREWKSRRSFLTLDKQLDLMARLIHSGAQVYMPPVYKTAGLLRRMKREYLYTRLTRPWTDLLGLNVSSSAKDILAAVGDFDRYKGDVTLAYPEFFYNETDFE